MTRRLPLFAIAALSLVAVAILLSQSNPEPHEWRLANAGQQASSATARPTANAHITQSERRRSLRRPAQLAAMGEDLPPRTQPDAALAAERAALTRDARAFLRAYLSYEVGALTTHTQHALADTSTVSFAEELLASPPRPTATGRLPPRARLLALELAFTGGGPIPTAQVDATVTRRASGREALSFSFQRRAGRWLAVSVGP